MAVCSPKLCQERLFDVKIAVKKKRRVAAGQEDSSWTKLRSLCDLRGFEETTTMVEFILAEKLDLCFNCCSFFNSMQFLLHRKVV
jgi:hypothetical protein